MKKVCLVLFGALLASSAFAGREPCSGNKGGIAYCEGDSFVCKDGTYSASRYSCSPSIYGTGKNGGKNTGSKTSKSKNSSQTTETPKIETINDDKIYGRDLTESDLSLKSFIDRFNSNMAKIKNGPKDLLEYPSGIKSSYKINFTTPVMDKEHNSDNYIYAEMLNKNINSITLHIKGDDDKVDLNNAGTIAGVLIGTVFPNISYADEAKIFNKIVKSKAEQVIYNTRNIAIEYIEKGYAYDDVFGFQLSFDLSKLSKKGLFYSTANDKYYTQTEINSIESQIIEQSDAISKNESDILILKNKMAISKKDLSSDDTTKTTVGVLTLGVSHLFNYKAVDIAKIKREQAALQSQIDIREKENKVYRDKIKYLKDILDTIAPAK